VKRLHAAAAAANRSGNTGLARELYDKMHAAQTKADQAAACEAASQLISPEPDGISSEESRFHIPASVQGCEFVRGGLPELRQRVEGCLVGAVCADAAAMGLHWVYDMDLMKQLTASAKSPAFYEPPSCPFYSYPSGACTPYWEQAGVLLAALVRRGGFCPRDYARANAAHFSHAEYDGYLDASTRGFLRNVLVKRKAWPHCGADDAQVNCVVRLPPMVAMFAGDPQLLSLVGDMVRVTQNTDAAVAYGRAAARVLEGIILGSAPLEAVEEAVRTLRRRDRSCPSDMDEGIARDMEAALALARNGTLHRDAVEALGRN